MGKNHSKNKVGILTSLSNIPIKSAGNYIEDVTSLFKSYRLENENLLWDKELFIPTVFFLFGTNDVLICSLCDDLEFASRFLRKFNFDRKNCGTNIRGKSISYSNCINLILSSNSICPIAEYKTFISSKNEFPLIGHISIQFNPILFAEYRERLYLLLYDFLKRNIDNDNTKIMVIDPMSWADLTILISSNSYVNIFKLIELVNSATLREMSKNSNHGNNLFKEIDNVFVVTRTTSNLGFSDSLLTNSNSFYANIKGDYKVFPISKGRIREKNFEEINSNYENQGIHLLVGEDDYIVFEENELENGITCDNLFNRVQKSFNDETKSNYSFQPNTIFFNPSMIFSHLKFRIENKNKKELELISKFDITHEKIKQLSTDLKFFKIPTPLRDGVINMIYDYKDSLYKNGAIHPLTSLKSIIEELLTFFRQLFDFVSENDRIEEKNFIYLGTVLQNFIVALRSSLSLRKNKGSHQFTHYSKNLSLILGIESILTSLSNSILDRSMIVFLDFHPTITVSDFALRINSYHLAQPEKLVSILMSEVYINISKTIGFKENYSNLNNIFTNVQSNPVLRNLAKDIGKYFKENLNSNAYENFVNGGAFHFFDYIEDDLFEHVVSDYINLNTLFETNFERYSFWYWSNILMFSQLYNPDRSLNVKYVLRYAIRFLYLCNLINKEVPFLGHLNKELEILVKNNQEQILEFCKVIEKTDLLKNISIDLNKLVTEIKLKINKNPNSKKANLIIHELLVSVEGLFDNGSGYGFSYSGCIHPNNSNVRKILFKLRMDFYREATNLCYEKCGEEFFDHK